MADFKIPEVLVSTHWVAQNLNAPGLRLVEVEVDTTAYDKGHIPGAVGWHWQTQLQDNVRRKNTVNLWMSAPPTNSAAKSSRLQDHPKPPNGQDTFPVPRWFVDEMGESGRCSH